MEKKTIIFDGGPLHNTFREVPLDCNKWWVHIWPKNVTKLDNKPVEVEIEKRYYEGTSTKYNGIQVFVWIDLKPTENESNNEGVKVS
jgi:hypothetical protein